MALASSSRFSLTDAWHRAVAVTLAAGLLRLVVAALTPLFPDETYYWEWSRRLATGYFDHPPLIAWIIRAGTLVAGDTALGVRLGPVLVGTLGALCLAASARRIAGGNAALWLAAAFAAMPLASGLVLATPDALLLAAAAATIYCVVRALQEAPNTPRSFLWWAASGAALGFGLLSKYTAVLLPFGIFVGLLFGRESRARLAEPGPYVATAIAIVNFSPVVFWNAANGWISFAFQLRHGLAAVGGSALGRELELIGGQMGLVSPVLFVLCAIAVWWSVRRPPAPLHRMLGVAAIVIFAFFMYSATKRRVEANWPALAYLPALLLAVCFLESDRWRRWMRGGVVLAGLLSAVVYLNAFVPVLPVPARRDPAARASGWDHLASRVHAVHGPRLALSPYATWVAAERYQDASELSFHLPERPEVFSLSLSSRPNQYEFWPTFPERAQRGDAMILVIDEVADTHATLALLSPHFGQVTQGELVTLARDGDPVKYLRIWMLDRWLGSWPR